MFQVIDKLVNIPDDLKDNLSETSASSSNTSDKK